jgi:hypothetical protein
MINTLSRIILWSSCSTGPQVRRERGGRSTTVGTDIQLRSHLRSSESFRNTRRFRKQGYTRRFYLSAENLCRLSDRPTCAEDFSNYFAERILRAFPNIPRGWLPNSGSSRFFLCVRFRGDRSVHLTSELSCAGWLSWKSKTRFHSKDSRLHAPLHLTF